MRKREGRGLQQALDGSEKADAHCPQIRVGTFRILLQYIEIKFSVNRKNMIGLFVSK